MRCRNVSAHSSRLDFSDGRSTKREGGGRETRDVINIDKYRPPRRFQRDASLAKKPARRGICILKRRARSHMHAERRKRKRARARA